MCTAKLGQRYFGSCSIFLDLHMYIVHVIVLKIAYTLQWNKIVIIILHVKPHTVFQIGDIKIIEMSRYTNSGAPVM